VLEPITVFYRTTLCQCAIYYGPVADCLPVCLLSVTSRRTVKTGKFIC